MHSRQLEFCFSTCLKTLISTSLSNSALYLPHEHTFISRTDTKLVILWTQQKIRVCIKHGQKEMGQRFTFSLRIQGRVSSQEPVTRVFLWTWEIKILNPYFPKQTETLSANPEIQVPPFLPGISYFHSEWKNFIRRDKTWSLPFSPLNSP